MNFRKEIYYLSLLLVFIIGSKLSFGQTDSLEIHTIKGKQYYIHLVQKGESLYFIHKQYDVPIEIIKKENPSVEDGLSIDEKIFIPVKKNIQIENQVDGNFIHHEVKKKQTLYFISKLYDVKQQEIILANPEISEGMKEGQVIKIPVLNIKKSHIDNSVNLKPNYKTHKITQGETLYSLSKLYNTTVDSIKIVNEGLKQGLKLGETIFVPIKLVVTGTDDISLLNDNSLTSLVIDSLIIKRKPEYSIGVMLPFYLDKNDEIVENRNALDEKRIYSKSKFALEFYDGLNLALDSLSNDTCKFRVFVYDTKGNDSTRIKFLLQKPEMRNMDLLIGPLYHNNFKKAARFAKENSIPIISPIKQTNKVLLGNSYVFKAIPSKSTSIKRICTLVADSFKTENLLAISYTKAKEKSLIDLYVNAYNKQLLNIQDTNDYTRIKVLEIDKNIEDVVSNLQMNKNNIIFVPVSNPSFVSSLFSYLISTLNRFDYKGCKVTLIGLEEWMKFESIDLEYFQKLNFHYSSVRYVNESDILTTNFINSYIKKTEKYPSKNVLLGFDLAYFFGSNFLNEGTLFSSKSIQEYKGISIDLNFFKTGIESGFENINSHILRFHNYTLEKLY